jgi:hypothetical protein
MKQLENRYSGTSEITVTSFPFSFGYFFFGTCTSSASFYPLSLHFPAIFAAVRDEEELDAASSNATVSTNVDGQAVPTPLAMAQHCIDINQTLRYINNDLLNMTLYMSEVDARNILESYQRTLQKVQQVKNKYETNFRRSATQLQ